METINSIKVRTVRAKELKDKMNENNIATYDVDNKKDDNIRFGRCSVLNDSIYLRFATDKEKGGINAKDGVICRDYINVDFAGNKKLREELYKNGFTIEYIKHRKDDTVDTTKIHYEMLMRSPSHAKEGHCLFINTKKRKKHLNYLMMGLYEKISNSSVDIVKLSAYMTLTTATSLGYLKIPWDSILVIKDIDEYCNKKAVIVKTNDENRLYCDWKDSWRLKNTIFDGQGLIDESIFPKETDDNGRPIYDGFVYCRNHFFKSCLFRGNIQEFFKDHYKDEYESVKITDMFGIEHYAKDIKVIVSTESLKWLKFTDLISGDKKEQYMFYDEILSKDDYTFQIIKTAHPSKYGNMVKVSCQMVSSLPCFGDNVNESIQKLVEPTVEFLRGLKSDTDKYVEYVENNSPDYKVDKALAAIYRKFPDFQYIDRFKERKKKALDKFRNYTTQGKMLFEGDNLTICDNPYEMLKASVGEYSGSETFKVHDDVIECYTNRFDDREYLAAFRSPHNSANGILYFKNNKLDIIKRYFPNIGNNVIFLNAIGTDWQDRTNSGDCDSDFLCVTNNEEVVRLSKYAYNEFPTIVNEIPTKGKKDYDGSLESYADMDNSLAENQKLIGESSNKAQILLDVFYDAKNSGEVTDEKLLELEEAIIIESVLAQACIDSTKNIFCIDLKSEVRRIDIYNMLKKDETGKYNRFPKIYAQITNEKNGGIESYKPKEYTDYKCTMDMASNKLSEEFKKLGLDKDLQIKNTKNIKKIDSIFMVEKPPKSRQLRRIYEICEEYAKETRKIELEKKNKQINDETYEEKKSHLTDECNEKISQYTKRKKYGGIDKSTMQRLLRECFFPSKMRHKGTTDLFTNKAITLLYNADPELFLECIEPVDEVKTEVKNMAV